MIPKSARMPLVGALVVGFAVAQAAPAAVGSAPPSATGSGHMVRPDGTFRSFSFSAREGADGTIKGQLQLNSRGFDVFVHINIDCLRVVGNVAYMSGRITHSSNPAEGVAGELNRWAVEDNGEGEDGTPDRVTSIPANPTNDPTQTCDAEGPDNIPPAPNRLVQRGNVQVRG
jgi:hypothetical protein